MDALSVRNDLPAFPLDVLPLLLAAICGWYFVVGKENCIRILRRGCSDRVFVIALAAASALVAILFAGLDPHVFPWGGLDRYFTRAVNIVTNGVFGYGNTPMALFPPGYSFLLLPSVLILGDTPWAFFLTNLVLLLSFAFVLRAALVRLGAEGRPANLLTLLIVLYPNRFLSAIIPFSDVPFSLLYAVALLFLLVRLQQRSGMGSALAIGLIGGIATLVRSNGLVTIRSPFRRRLRKCWRRTDRAPSAKRSQPPWSFLLSLLRGPSATTQHSDASSRSH